MGRTLIVGDVHGCLDELDGLLEKTRFAQGVDDVVLVGDLVARGPNPKGFLDRVAKIGARSVRGNHDARLLEVRRRPQGAKPELVKLAADLSHGEWRYLEAMPLMLDLPEHGALVVHAGVIPGRPIEHTPSEALLTIRALDERGRWTDDKRATALWGEGYVGPPHVVFGHNALDEPQLHEWATGIDTGCVYGGRLTALVLEERESVPRGKGAAAKLTSVQARRVYCAGHPGPIR
jgi:hypothetical protein